MHRLRGVLPVFVAMVLGLSASVSRAAEPEGETIAAYLGRFHELDPGNRNAVEKLGRLFAGEAGGN